MWKATKSLNYRIRRLGVWSNVFVYLDDKYTMFNRIKYVQFESQFRNFYNFITFYEKNRKRLKSILRSSDLYGYDDEQLVFKFRLEVTLTDKEVEDIVKKVKQKEKYELKEKEKEFERLKKELGK